MDPNLLNDETITDKQITDEELVRISKLGNKQAESLLINRYKNFVKIKARSYFLIGADKEDIIQEGMIGLFKGIRDYNPEKACCFKSFAELCIQRQIITAIKSATRLKHSPLNTYISLDMPLYNEEFDKTLIDSIANTKVLEPEEIIISQEEVGNMEAIMLTVLSDLEWVVLTNYVTGKSYYEIAEELNREVKSIDNALQRVKKKLENSLNVKIKVNI